MKYSISYLVFSILAVLLLYCIPYTAYHIPVVNAVDATSSATKSKLSAQLIEEIASKAAKLKKEILNKLQNKAYVGKVKLVSSSSITLATESGVKIVSLNQDTLYESQTKKKFSFKTLTQEDLVAALGDVDENEVLTAKKIILLPNLNSKMKTHIWGQVVSISGNSLTILTKESKNISILIDSTTDFQKSSGSALFSDLIRNNFIIVTGIFNDNQVLQADFIYIYSQPGFIKPKIATDSAKVATKSAK